MANLIVEKEKSIVRIKLTRADVHNAFNAEMISDITKAFREVAKDNAVRAVILSGEGKSFCSGADLSYMKSMVDYDLKTNMSDAEKLSDMFDAVLSCPVPVLGRVHGSVMGGGLGLTAVCDIVAADKESKFCFSEVKLGIVPSVISPFVLRKCALHLAQEVMLTAEIFGTEKAKDMGLIHFIGEGDEIDDYIQSKADFILNNGPEAVRTTKQLLRFVIDNTWSEVRKKTIETIAERRISKEGQEGIRAFLDKRSPSWKQK